MVAMHNKVILDQQFNGRWLVDHFIPQYYLNNWAHIVVWVCVVHYVQLLFYSLNSISFWTSSHDIKINLVFFSIIYWNISDFIVNRIDLCLQTRTHYTLVLCTWYSHSPRTQCFFDDQIWIWKMTWKHV